MRKLSAVIVFALLPTAAFAQTSVVAKYRSQYPTPMSKAQMLALEKSVAAEVHGGLLIKPDGENCGGFSCDIICFSDAELYDILIASDEAGTPAWNRTDNPRGYRCDLSWGRVAPAPTPTPTPTPAPTPEIDVSGLLKPLLDELAQLRAELVALRASIDKLQAQGIVTKIRF